MLTGPVLVKDKWESVEQKELNIGWSDGIKDR